MPKASRSSHHIPDSERNKKTYWHLNNLEIHTFHFQCVKSFYFKIQQKQFPGFTSEAPAPIWWVFLTALSVLRNSYLSKRGSWKLQKLRLKKDLGFSRSTSALKKKLIRFPYLTSYPGDENNMYMYLKDTIASSLCIEWEVCISYWHSKNHLASKGASHPPREQDHEKKYWCIDYHTMIDICQSK